MGGIKVSLGQGLPTVCPSGPRLDRPAPAPPCGHSLGLVPGHRLHLVVGQQVWAVTHLHVHHALLGLHLHELIGDPFDGLPAAPGREGTALSSVPSELQEQDWPQPLADQTHFWPRSLSSSAKPWASAGEDPGSTASPVSSASKLPVLAPFTLVSSASNWAPQSLCLSSQQAERIFYRSEHVLLCSAPKGSRRVG